MAQPNWWLLLPVALIPLVIGFIWYNPKVFGNAWMRTAEIDEERAQSGNMIKIFGLTYLFSLLAAYMIAIGSVHQSGIAMLFMGDPALEDPNSSISTFVNEFMTTYGDRHRSFFHGMIHGIETAIFYGLAFIGINCLFERRPFKYALIHIGYWTVCLAIMGGLLCQFF